VTGGTHWTDGRLVGLDLETTGPDPEEARIVSASLVEVGGGLPLRERAWLVDPGVEIPEGATEVHGITTERVREEGRQPVEALTELLEALKVCDRNGDRPAAPLVIFNARYDFTVLDREVERLGGHADLGRFRVVDPLVLDRWLHRYRKGSRRLDAQLVHYGIEQRVRAGVAAGHDAHDATSDALNAVRLAWAICRRPADAAVVARVRGKDEAIERAQMRKLWDVVRTDLDALHEFQQGIAWQEADRLADYFRSVGKVEEADGVRRDWPVVPVGATS
jgi:DNA polymerase-3 subunit epsilon